jgi:hypothetical protein
MAKVALPLVILSVVLGGAPAHAWIPGVYIEEPGARAAGMGGCFVSVADDAWAAVWNPAGLAFLNADVSVAGVYQRAIPEWDTNLWCSSAAIRTERLGSFATAVEYYTYQEQIYADPDEPETSTFTPNELSWSLGYGYALFGHLGVGGAVKRLRVFAVPDELVMHGSGTASAWAFDAGVLYRQEHQLGLGAGVLRLGVSVLHMGEDLSFRESGGGPDPEPLPTRWKAGASYGVDSGKALRALLCVETTWPIEQYEESAVDEEHPTIGAGLELALGSKGKSGPVTAAWSPRGEIIGRIGFVKDDDEELSGLSFGLGAALRSRAVEFRVDFASSPRYGELDRPWQLGASIGVWR